MSTLLRASAAAALLSVMSTPAMAEESSRTFDSPALSIDELARVHGQGSPRGAFWRDSTREQVDTFGQQNSALMRVTFENWFLDVGSPLIWNNVISGR